MNALQALILGIVQGVAEFLPISSSGHLVVVPWALGWASPGLLFDTLAHWGTLLAVIIYFWRDLWSLLRSWVSSVVRRRIDTPEARLAWIIVLATIPGAVLGYLLESVFEGLFNSPAAVGIFLLVTAAILASVEFLHSRLNDLHSIGVGDGVFVGIAQALAIAPGLSRSGLTISAGMFRGLSRAAAARFSFLLSIPIILGAGLAQIVGGFGGVVGISTLPLVLGFGSALVSGYIAIHFFLRFVQRHRMWLFAGYCGVLGIVVLLVSAL